MNAPFEQLPSELNIRIFEYLSVNELCLCLRVDRNWNRWIQDADYLWENKLRQLGLKNLAGRTSGRAEKISKMELFIRLYKEHLVRMNWKTGRMSKISSYNDIPSIHICPLDVEAWGEIFELELSR